MFRMPVDVITDTSDDEYLINTAENEGIEIYGNTSVNDVPVLKKYLENLKSDAS